MDTATADIDTDALSARLAGELGETFGADPIEGESTRVDDLDTTTDPGAEKDATDGTAASTGAARDEQGRFTKAASADATTPAVADQAAIPGADDLPVPKSWAKETHALWQKAARGEPLTKEEARTLLTTFNTRETQMADGAKAYATDAEYGRSVRAVIGKHEDILRAQNVEPVKALEYFFSSHRQLSNPDKTAARAHLEKVASHYGIDLAPADPNAPAPAALPPEVKAALEKVERFEGAFNAEHERRYEERRATTTAEVNAFAADPKHAYFEECSDHICTLLKGDPGMTLQTAYDTAVWANPLTRQKELTRIQQETDEKNRKAREAAAAAAKKSTSTNVKGRDTARAPQAPPATLNNLDDVMRETQEELRSRSE